MRFRTLRELADGLLFSSLGFGVMAAVVGTLVAFHTPFGGAPRHTISSDSGSLPARNMKKAIVAKKIGHSTASRPSKADRDIILKWTSHPTPSSLMDLTR